MSVADHTKDTSTQLVSICENAGFVHLVGVDNGASLAATGVMARTLRAIDIPFQASLASFPDEQHTSDDATIAIGWNGGDISFSTGSLVEIAWQCGSALAPDVVEPDLAFAGLRSEGFPMSTLEIDRPTQSPGIALPTEDVITGLAASSNLRGPFSGTEENASSFVSELALEEQDIIHSRKGASAIALAVLRDTGPRGSDALTNVLHPHQSSRFMTIEGYAEILDAIAKEEPGTGLALVLGNPVEEDVYHCWQQHGKQAHQALSAAETQRHKGLFVARSEDDFPLRTISRICHNYVSPEPITVAVGQSRGAIVASSPISEGLLSTLDMCEGTGIVHETTGHVRFDCSSEEFVNTLRETL